MRTFFQNVIFIIAENVLHIYLCMFNLITQIWQMCYMLLEWNIY